MKASFRNGATASFSHRNGSEKTRCNELREVDGCEKECYCFYSCALLSALSPRLYMLHRVSGRPWTQQTMDLGQV